MKKMLLSFAHPDDESFACGGTISKYVKNGWNIQLICSTFGQAGKSEGYEDLEEDALGIIRKAELEDASEILGLSEITYLEYQDGYLDELKDGELEDRIFYTMINFAPDIVVTFDNTGISNHPDHIKMSYATTFAFQKYTKNIIDTRSFVEKVNYRDPSLKKRQFLMRHNRVLKSEAFIDIAENNDDPKLYYVAMPETIASYLKKNKVIPESLFGKPWLGVADDRITTVIDIKRFASQKKKAMMCHKTQQNDIDRNINFLNNPMFRQEFYILRMQGQTEIYMGKNDEVKDRF